MAQNMNQNGLVRICEIPDAAREAVNTLRGNLALRNPDVRAIGLTGDINGDAAPLTAAYLARSMAQTGARTVFVDCDIRGAGAGKSYTEKPSGAGLTEYLSGKAGAQSVVRPTNCENLSAIVPGAKADNPSELFSGARFAELIEALKADFDAVIVAAPAAGEVIDGALAARACDGAILVMTSGVTQGKRVRAIEQQMHSDGVNLIGSVLFKA